VHRHRHARRAVSHAELFAGVWLWCVCVRARVCVRVCGCGCGCVRVRVRVRVPAGVSARRRGAKVCCALTVQ
jgi:hypothetical protein